MGIPCKALFTDSGTPYFRIFKKMRRTDVKVLSGVTPSAIMVMGSVSMIFTYREEPSFVHIENADIANSFAEFFKGLWLSAK